MLAPQRDIDASKFSELQGLGDPESIDHLEDSRNRLTVDDAKPAVRGRKHASFEETIALPCTEDDVRAFIALFRLLDEWDRSSTGRTSNPNRTL